MSAKIALKRSPSYAPARITDGMSTKGTLNTLHAISARAKTYVLPVFSYPRTYGASITGGYVYRGNKTPHMIGWYITGDYESRRIWALSRRIVS